MQGQMILFNFERGDEWEDKVQAVGYQQVLIRRATISCV